MKKLLSGNEAIVYGALRTGASFFAGYPITPASEIMHEWAKISAKNKKMVFLQTEDEIAAIHSIIGASLAGKKSFTATSGPGFSLMQEGIGLGFAMHVPMVIVDVQRQGPSTGMPTISAQGDLLQTQHGSHGDYKTIVFYPNSVQECFDYSIRAFNAAEECLSPVILLSDGYLAGLSETINERVNYKIIKRKLTPLGQEKRLFTGLTSIENKPSTQKPADYKKWIKERFDLITKTSKKYEDFEYLENKNAKALLISFGITSRLAYDFINDYSLFRPIRLFPVLKKLLEINSKYDRIITIEANNGQYANALKSFLQRNIDCISLEGGELSREIIENKLKNI